MVEGMQEDMVIRVKEEATRGEVKEEVTKGEVEEGREMGARDWVRDVESNNTRKNN